MLGTPSPKWDITEQLLCKQKALSGWGGVEVQFLGQGELSNPKCFLGTRGALGLNAHHPGPAALPKGGGGVSWGLRSGPADLCLRVHI